MTGVLLFAVSAALTLLCTPIVFAALSTTGRWTPLPTGTSPANWDHPPIHMALLRGDSNYHSYIMSWYQNPNDSTWLGGLWGWNPSGTDDGCLAYPESTLVKITSQPAAPGAQIFCAGHAALADGRLLVAGGTDRVGETAGIKDVRIFNAQSKTWSAADTMAFRRYYPTNTTLPDGRVLVNEGWQYDHMLTFGGRTVPGNSTSAQKKIERLTILDTAHWDAQITDPGGTTDWPEERAFHTAVIRRDPADPANEDHMRMMLFGGADTNGVALRDTWMLKRSQWNDTTESYTWEQIADGPRRARHGAIVNNDYSMYIFGGFDADSVVQSDVRRLFKNASNEWQWEVKTTSGTDTPGARYGHVVAHDT
ncbi:MAG TPA: hypothetical protein VFF24_09180, partial [Acidimicrobiia bacterium]|nr:hypothetical protein [Acidimicrobiia bacterium]